MSSGIYLITNNVNGKVYVGQSVNIERRWLAHKEASENGKELHLYRAIRKYGIDNFSLKVLMYINDKSLMNELEAKFIIDYNSTDRKFGYNLQSGGKSFLQSEETKEKLRTVFSSENVKEKCRVSHLGKRHSESSKEKMRQAKLGVPQSKEHINNCRASKLGKRPSLETKEKMRKAHLGLHWFTNGIETVKARTCPGGYVPGRRLLSR